MRVKLAGNRRHAGNCVNQATADYTGKTGANSGSGTRAHGARHSLNNQNHPRRGFLLTLDAMLALTLVTFTAWFVFANFSDSASHTSGWFLAAHDQAINGMDTMAFYRATGTRVTGSSPTHGTHAAAYAYEPACAGEKSSDAECFSKNDALMTKNRYEVWAGT